MTKYKVIGSVPTVHTYSNLAFWGTPEKQWDGSFTLELDFESERAAKDYLINCVLSSDEDIDTDEIIENIEATGVAYYANDSVAVVEYEG